MLAELKTTASSNKIQSFYTKEEEYDLVYITVILLAVLLDSGTAGTPPPSSLRRGRWMLDISPLSPPLRGGAEHYQCWGEDCILELQVLVLPKSIHKARIVNKIV